MIISRLLDFCLSTSLEKHLEMEIDSLRANKFRLMLKDGMLQTVSDFCLARTTFLNTELIEKIVEPLSWAIQNDYSIIRKVQLR